MATQNVNIGINVSDNGTAKKVVQSFKEITKAATEAQQAAQGTRVPLGGGTTTGMPGGGTSGSRMVAAKLAPTSSQGMGSEQYGNLRGSAGMTGASARDFANQAQGLGGLVRLYATYAANIFAVSAAFSALSNAMDTANLVKGLDQLGAASGTALGTLSKRLVETTDGAISLREAMESTAKASSSGMSSENILRMGKVAKQAAQALGVDMSDAVNRLTRGITKLEPELLDELGIFTKVDMATQAYAKSVGKSAGAITDFEKRMAFANAVLEEGERKFNAIDFETNPYTKLLASLKNVAQEGLELVNTVLAPIVRFMSESPKALAIAIGALGLALVKQALPALGQFKAGLAAASEEAQELATKKAADAVTAQKQLSSLLLQERDDFANKELQKLDVAAERLNQAGVRKNSAAAKLLDTNFAALSDKDLQQVEKRIENVNKQAKIYTEQAQQAAKAGASPEIVDSLYEKADAYKYASTVAAGSLAAERKYEETSRQTKQANTVATLQANVAENARVASIKQNIVTNAAYNGSLIGVTGSIKLMNAELQQSGLNLGVFGKSMLFARAGVAAFAGMVTTVMSSIGGFLNIIATVSAAVAFAASFFSTNSKQVQAFGSAITATDDSLLNLGRTLDDIARKPFGEQFNTKSLLATATAITEIGTSISSLVTKILDADKAASGFDRFIDGVKTLWGGDLRSQFGKSISTAVFDSFEKLSDSQEAKKAKASIAAILDVSPEASKQDFEAAFKSIADNEPKLRQVERAMKDLGMSFGQTADDAQQFDIATTQSKESLKKFTDQFKVTDPLSQFAASIIDQSSKTAKALELPENAIARLSSIVQDTAQLQLFGLEDQKSLMQYGEQIVNVNKNFEAQKRAVKDSAQEVKKLEKALDDLRRRDDYNKPASDSEMAGNRAFDQAKKQLDDRREQLSREQNLLQSTQTEVTTLTARFPQLAANQLAKGADILYTSIAAGFAKGSNSFADAVMGAVGDLPGLAKQRTDMELRKLQSESQLLKIQASMLQATLANTAQLQKRSAEEAVGIAQSDVRQVGDDASIARLQKAQEELDEINKKISIIQIDPKQALDAIGRVKKEILSGNALIQKDATELFGYLTSLAGNAQQQANNATDEAAIKFKGILALQAEKAKQELKALDASKTANSLQIEALNITKQQDGFLSEQRIGELQSLQNTAAKIAGSEKELAIQQKLDALETAKTKGGTFAPTQEVYLAEKALLLTAKKNVQTETENKLKQIGISATKQVAEEQQRQVTLQNELNAKYKQGTDALQATADKQLDIQNETAKSLGTYTPEYQAQQDAQLQATKVRLQAEREAQALTTQFIITSYKLQAEAKEKLEAGAGPAAIKEVEDRLAVEAAAYGNKVVAINSARDAELNALKQIEEQRKKTDDFTNLLDVIKNLDSVWTSFGSNLASTVSVFTALTKSQKQYAATVADLEFERDAETDAKKKLEWQEKIDKTTKDSVKAEISGYGKVAGESKKLFKEKTVAYKTLNTIEKAMHIQRIALDLKEFALKMGLITKEQVAKAGAWVKELAMKANNALISIGIDIPAIYAKTIGQLGIFGPPVAAAMIAAFVGVGGKGGNTPFVPSAEQRQETQGTAMGFDSQGQKVQVRRGVFGDTDAKSESIANSLEIIKDNSVDGLSYDNRMLNLLTSIDSGINKTAKGLYGIQGLRSGSMSGTIPGTQSGGGLLGSGFLGSKTTRNITDSGLLIEGTFAQLASDTNAAVIDFFEQVTVSKKTWYGKTKTWIETTRTEIDNATSEFFQGIFSNATELFVEVGSKAGINVSAINEILGGMDVGENFASLRGLKGEDFQNELSAIIGTILDDAALAIFTEFEQFANFGEGMLETVVRVIDSNDKVRQQIKNTIGQDIQATLTETGVMVESDTSKGFFGLVTKVKSVLSFDPKDIQLQSYKVTESLISLAGGIENFVDQSNFFRENFLTESERLVPVQKAVTAEMARLGFSSIDTREEFKLLVQGLDVTTEAGRENYQALMNVAEGFAEITPALENVGLSAEDFAAKAKSMQMRILELTGTAEEFLAAQRAQTLQETDVGLRSTQEYIFALEDVKTAEDALSKARQAEANKLKEQQKVSEGFIGSIKRYIDSLRKFKDSLLLSAASPLTPAEKYREAKQQFDAILATAMGTAVTPAEQSAKEAALGQLEGASSSFLEASRVYNASSAQYTEDFTLVQTALTQTSASLANALTVEEKSLAALNTQISTMEKVDQSVLSVADAVNNLASALRAKDLAATQPGVSEQISAASTLGTAMNSSLGGKILGNELFGLNGLKGVVSGTGGSTEGTLNFMRLVEAGDQTAAELRRIYVEDWGLDSKMMAYIVGSTQQQVLDWFKMMDPSLPAFAQGTNFVPEDMLAQIHQGERIIPAADNAQLMTSLNNRDEANRVLVDEIRNLRSEVKQLREQQAKETGNIIVANFDAQQRAAEKIEIAMNNTAQQSTWTAKVREGVKLK
jgi:hypothetical protein